MKIERYTDQYEDDVRRLVQAFMAESLAEYGLTFSEGALQKQIDLLKGQAFVLVIDGRCQGILAGKEVYTPTGGDKVWHEVIWYVDEDHRKYGIRLLDAARGILKAEGFTSMVMVYMHNSKSDKLARLYTRLGMQPMETNYIGRL